MSLLERLRVHEGFRARPYDDATGRELRRGDVVRGTVTIGYGATWVSREMAEVVLQMHVELVESWVRASYPWVDELPESARDIVLEMGFQLGEAGLAKFAPTLAAFERHDWAEASRRLGAAKLARDAPSRVAEYQRELAALERGELPRPALAEAFDEWNGNPSETDEGASPVDEDDPHPWDWWRR